MSNDVVRSSFNEGLLRLYNFIKCFVMFQGKDVHDTSFEGEHNNVSIEETWRGMEKCVEKGLAKSIGVSNFNSGQIKRILDCAKIKPVNLQVCYFIARQDQE